MANKRIKVCHITTVHPVHSTRIFYKQCLSTVRAGYSVTLIVPHHCDEWLEGIRIKALPQAQNRFYRIFVSTLRAYKMAIREKADIFHFHDPELLFVGLMLKIAKQKVVYDIHEYIPEQIMNKKYIKSFKLKGIISKFYEFIEKIAIIFLDKLCTVTPIIAEKYPQDKVFLVRNFVSKSFCKSPNYKFETNEKISGIFVGGLTRNRLIHNLINAAGQLNGEMDLRLIGKWESQEYKDQCAKLFGWKFVDYIGFIPNQEVQDYIRTADIGFHILEPKSNYLQGMYPTKVFEYFACGVPVIMPKWFKRLCIYDDSAFFVDPENMKEIITTLRYINLYKWRLREKGKNAYNLVQQKMNWESEFEVLISNYMQLIDKRR